MKKLKFEEIFFLKKTKIYYHLVALHAMRAARTQSHNRELAESICARADTPSQCAAKAIYLRQILQPQKYHLIRLAHSKLIFFPLPFRQSGDGQT